MNFGNERLGLHKSPQSIEGSMNGLGGGLKSL
jgi:hypothetical protein